MNLILIGMPGCGKSTAGVLAAKAMCMQFLDTDLLLQEYAGLPLQQILDQRGLDYFLQAEERVLANLAVENCVVATGGSAVYYPAAMRHLKEIGKVIYLRLPFETMRARIHNLDSRGIALKPGMTLRDMYAERAALYQSYADAVVDCSAPHVEETVARIVRHCR